MTVPPSRVKDALWAWGGIVAYVALYDGFAVWTRRSTLSAAFHYVSTRKVGRPLLVMFWLYLTAHLFRWLPRKLDLFRS